jgi:hypothetical protein
MGGLRKTMQFSGISEIENRLVVRTKSLHELGGLADPPRFRLGKLPIIPFCQHSSEGRVPDVRLAHLRVQVAPMSLNERFGNLSLAIADRVAVAGLNWP